MVYVSSFVQPPVIVHEYPGWQQESAVQHVPPIRGQHVPTPAGFIPQQDWPRFAQVMQPAFGTSVLILAVSLKSGEGVVLSSETTYSLISQQLRPSHFVPS